MTRGPIFQRASIVVNKNEVLSSQTTLRIASFLPNRYYFRANETLEKTWRSSEESLPDFPHSIRLLVQETQMRQPIKVPYSGCKGVCKARVIVSCKILPTVTCNW